MIFIAGPSQMYGWVGPGSYAPYNIPNIFKAAGINTRWIPGINPLFNVGLTYPQPSAPVQPAAAPPIVTNQILSGYTATNKVKKSIPNALYKKPTEHKSASSPAYPGHGVDQPAIPPPYTGPSTLVKTTTTTQAPTTTTTSTTTTTTRRPVTRTVKPFVNLRGSPAPSYVSYGSPTPSYGNHS